MNPLILKKLHETEIEILDEIDRLCKKHNLVYFLEGGTLLGAVRHKGFIPWDDDLDIAMPRNDYEKFLRIGKSELSDKFDILSLNIKTYSQNFTKIQKKNTLFLEKHRLYDDNNCNRWGINVDIFPLDNAKCGFFTYVRRWLILKIKHWIFIKMGLVKEKTIKSKTISVLLFFTSVNFLKKCMDNLSKLKDDNCTHLISMGSRYETKRALWLKNKVLPVSQIEFEGKIYYAPHVPDYFLRIQYGNNYMEIPPMKERITHEPGRISFNIENGYEEI